ncbi:MAG: hypothetical protein U0Z75_10235 [Deinococcaceae bacterium]
MWISLCIALLFSQARTPFEQAQDSGVVIGKQGWLFHIAEFGNYTLETPQDSETKRITIEVISKLFAKRNIPLVLALIPAKIHLYESSLPPEMPLPDVVKNRYVNALQSLTSNGVNVPDLLTAFQKGQQDPIERKYPVYQKLDHHWSSRGALIAAQVIGNALRELPQLNDEAHAQIQLAAQPEEVYLESSLIKRVPEALRSSFVPEAFIPYDEVKSDPSLLGDEAFPIALVGSSASKGGRLWPFDSGIAAETQFNVLNAAQVGRGPWLPLEDYLRSSTYQESPPKALVWQLWEAFLLDVDQGQLPKNWLWTIAPLILGSCDKPVLGSGPTLDLPATQWGDYLSASVQTQSGREWVLSLSTPNGTVTRDEVVPSEGETQYFNEALPLGTTRIEIKPKNPQTSVTLSSAKICKIPSEVSDALQPQGSVDLVRVDRYAGLETFNFSGVENGTMRWSEGPEMSIHFWNGGTLKPKVQLAFYNPIEGQHVRVKLNGTTLLDISALTAGTNITKDFVLPAIPGDNTLSFEYTLANGMGSTFAEQDTRKLTVLFNTLRLDFSK